MKNRIISFFLLLSLCVSCAPVGLFEPPDTNLTASPPSISLPLENPETLQTYKSGEPRETQDAQAVEAELQLLDIKPILRDLRKLNNNYKTRSGWYHSIIETSDIYYQYTKEKPDDSNLERDQSFSDYLETVPPSHVEESWIELDGAGEISGNRLTVIYNEDGEPVSAYAIFFDGGINIINVIMNADMTPGEILDVQENFAIGNLSVSRLNPCFDNLNELFGLTGLDSILSSNSNENQTDLFHIEGVRKNAVPLDLPYFPEAVEAFRFTYQFDHKNGECLLSLEDAIGQTGNAYQAVSNALVLSEIIESLPADALSLYNKLLELFPVNQ